MTIARKCAPHPGAEPRAKKLARPAASTGARDDARHVLEVLSDQVWPLPDFGMVAEVSLVDGAREERRRADALVLDLRPNAHDRLVLLGIEVKLSRGDYLAEIADLAKSAPARAVCDEFWIATRAPWTNVVPKVGRTIELPDRWGLIEVAGGRATVIVHPVARPALEPVSPDHQRGLFRAALTSRARAELDLGAPERAIVLRLSVDNVALTCDHTALAPRGPLSKWPRTVPCWKCEEGRPADLDGAVARIERASGEELTTLWTAVEAQTRRAC